MDDLEFLQQFNERFYLRIREVTDDTITVAVCSIDSCDGQWVQQDYMFSRAEQDALLSIWDKPPISTFE